MITNEELKTYDCNNLTDYFDKILNVYGDGFMLQSKLMSSCLNYDQRQEFIDYLYDLFHYEITSDERIIEEVRQVIKDLNLSFID